MHYIIAHKIGGKLVLAINSKDRQIMGSEDLDETMEYIKTACTKHPKYSPAILRYKSLYDIDQSIEEKRIKLGYHLTGVVHYVSLKKNYSPDVVKYAEIITKVESTK